MRCGQSQRRGYYRQLRRAIRFRNNDVGEVRVYPGKLQVSESFCLVSVSETTTIADLINEALDKFGLQNFNCDDYRCSEILLDRGGTCSIDSNSRPILLSHST